MYADDLVLLSILICDLQALVNICVNELALIDVIINCNNAVSELEIDILFMSVRSL